MSQAPPVQQVQLAIEACEAFPREFATEFLKRLRARTPVGETGNLQASWYEKLTPAEIQILNDMDYWSFVEYGTDHMAPRGMVRTTALEAQAIAEVAAKRARRGRAT